MPRCLAMLALLTVPCAARAEEPGVVYPGGAGPGQGKRVVLVAGDEEYRSEETLPQLGKILSQRHGFRCTVLLPIGTDGAIDPNASNIPGTEALKDADLLILFTRMRHLPDSQMRPLVEYIESGKPIMGLRTATHAFDNPPGSTFAHYDWKSKVQGWEQGFGRKVLGETWISHHGHHGKESCRGLLAPGAAEHPILRGLKDGAIWGPTDVYGVRLPLPGDSRPLVLGQVVAGMKETDPPVAGAKNQPMMPIAWTKSYTGTAGKTARVFATTMGCSQDLQNAGYRRLLVNAAYWCLGMEAALQPDADVGIVGKYEPSPFKFNGGKKGVKPADHRL